MQDPGRQREFRGALGLVLGKGPGNRSHAPERCKRLMILINERCMRLILRLILTGEASGASRGRCPVRNTWSLNGVLSGERWICRGGQPDQRPKGGKNVGDSAYSGRRRGRAGEWRLRPAGLDQEFQDLLRTLDISRRPWGTTAGRRGPGPGPVRGLR